MIHVILFKPWKCFRKDAEEKGKEYKNQRI